MLGGRLHAPQPGQNVGCEHCNSRAGGDASQAWGDWKEDVPKGLIGVAACYGGRKNGQYAGNLNYYLVPNEEYTDSMFVVDPLRHPVWPNQEMNHGTKRVA